MNRIELLCNQLTFQRLMRARVYIGMATSIMLHATASSIILSSRRNGTGDIENMSEVYDFHGIHLLSAGTLCPSLRN